MSVNGLAIHLVGDEPISPRSHGQLTKTPVPAQVCAEGHTGANDVRKRSNARGDNVGRFRVMTEKGVGNQKTTHIENRDRATKRLNCLMRSIDELVKNNGSVGEIKDGMIQVDHIFAEVTDSHGKYHAIIDNEEERKKSSKWMNDYDGTVFGFKSYVNK